MQIRSFSMRGGVHLPPYRPELHSLPSTSLPVPPRVVVPLLQHAGVPARPVVWTNDKVKIGQLLAEPGGPVSAAIHSPVSGTVVSVKAFPHPNGRAMTAIEIEDDGAGTVDTPRPLGKPWQDAAPGEILNTIAAGGIVGTEAHPLPAHLSLSVSGDVPVDVLIVNGTDQDPFSTSAHRLIAERTEEVLTGACILRKTVGAQKAWIAVTSRELVTLLREKLSAEPFTDIGIARMPARYPCGDRRVLSKSIARTDIPVDEGGASAGCVVVEAATAHAAWNMVCKGIPLFERLVTVAGPAVGEPANLYVRVGTPLRTVLEHCRTDFAALTKVALGGSMRGEAQPWLDAPVTKEVTSIFATDELHPSSQGHRCIRCGYCVLACPMRLVPSVLAGLVREDRHEEAMRNQVMQCTECGACSWICPSKINLVHYLQLGKYHAANLLKAEAA